MNFVTFLLATTLILFMPFFCVFVQTIKNLIAFVLLIFLVAVNLMLFYSIEFFPIFFMLIYVGAIVVTTLFMVLTFDLRTEYASKKIFDSKALFNTTLYFFLTPVFFIIVTGFEKSMWLSGTLNESHRIILYQKCLTNKDLSTRFCNINFGRADIDEGLYHAINNSTNDVALVSNNLYTGYGVWFVVLGVILTIALVVALAILKKK